MLEGDYKHANGIRCHAHTTQQFFPLPNLVPEPVMKTRPNAEFQLNLCWYRPTDEDLKGLITAIV